ncbi:MAG: GAF domain-containing protein [Armatimonadota bacterium]
MSSISSDLSVESKKLQTFPHGAGLTLKLGFWGVCLVAALAVSVITRLPFTAPSVPAYITICAMTSAVYLAVFTHCLMRLVYCRCPSWLLYTSSFAALSISGLIGVVVNLGPIESATTLRRLYLLRSALLPIATTLLIFASHALKASTRGHRLRTWKISACAALGVSLLVVIWRTGVWHSACNMIRSTNLDPLLAIYIISAATSIVLLCEVNKLAGSSPNEIFVPVCYWSVAMVIETVLTLISWTFMDTLRFKIMGVELAGVMAMLIGLSIENERAHRGAAQRMSDLEAMQKVSWSLVGAGDLGELMSTFVKAISEGFQDAPVVAYLDQEDGGESLTIAAVTGIDDPTIYIGKVCSLRPERRPGFHNGHTARAFASAEVQTAKVVFTDVEFMPWRMVAHEEGMVVSVPLPHQNRVIGVVNLFLSGARDVTEDRIRQLEAVAAAVSPAIENTRLRARIADACLGQAA